jgi:GNAT superfamily N-acetyltransferase
VRPEVTTRDGVTVRLQPADGIDEPFLHRLYADRRAPELALVGWSTEQCAAFVDMQFRAQQQGYAGAFPDAEHWIVLVDERPVGRLLVDRRQTDHRVVDLVILSEWRGRGIGTALMHEVLDDARVASVPVGLAVAPNEPHLVRWYGRLGFSVVDRGDGLEMASSPVQPAVEGG